MFKIIIAVGSRTSHTKWFPGDTFSISCASCVRARILLSLIHTGNLHHSKYLSSRSPFPKCGNYEKVFNACVSSVFLGWGHLKQALQAVSTRPSEIASPWRGIQARWWKAFKEPAVPVAAAEGSLAQGSALVGSLLWADHPAQESWYVLGGGWGLRYQDWIFTAQMKGSTSHFLWDLNR